MDNYKKRKAPKRLAPPKKKLKLVVEEKPKKQLKNSPIKITKTNRIKKSVPEKSKIRVIMGGKERIERKKIISASVVASILAAVLIFSLLTPTGPFEYIQTAVHSIGVGSFPNTLSGSRVINTYHIGSSTYILTDSHAEVFNNSGKKLFSRQHEFNSPVLDVAEQRSIIFDRGGRRAFVFNNNDVLYELSLKNDIYSATIARNGTYAVATKSDSYTSQVEVFGKNRKSKFTWFSSDAIINDIALSNNGRRLAVATVDASSGKYKSKVAVFEYSNPNPLYVFEYENTMVYSVNCISNTYFSIVTSEGIHYVPWRRGTTRNYEDDYTLNSYKYKKNFWNISVAGNKTNNTVTLYDKKGNVKSEFDFNGAVTDISSVSNHIFILSDGYLYSLDDTGKEFSQKINASGYDRLIAIDSNTVFIVGNYGIDKIKIK